MGKKTLCDLAKKLPRKLEKYAALVRDASHVCKDCGRAANSEARLCKPTPLEIEAPDACDR